ncbi:MAG: ribonuclease III [Pseudomonadota bacterium]
MVSPRSTRFEALEDLIGYRFTSHEHLGKALTHASATRTKDQPTDYERLEFLGDRVLGLCVADLLFRTFPQASEGELSLRLNALVSGDACAEIADALGLHQFIRSGNDLKYLQSKRMKSVRADVLESLIASIFLDGGLDAAHAFVERFWSKRLHHDNAARRDSKTALQEWAHSGGFGTPKYEITGRDGPDHEPVFTVKVILSGCEGATGTGRSKRSAEQEAAEEILIREGVWSEANG